MVRIEINPTEVWNKEAFHIKGDKFKTVTCKQVKKNTTTWSEGGGTSSEETNFGNRKK